MFLPGNKDKVKEMGLLGHWSNHKKYTNEIDKDLDVLNKLFKRGELSDMDVLLGLGGIQCQARAKFIKTLPALNQLFFESVVDGDFSHIVDHPSINNDGFPVDKRHYTHTFEELNQLIKSIKFTGTQYSKV